MAVLNFISKMIFSICLEHIPHCHTSHVKLPSQIGFTHLWDHQGPLGKSNFDHFPLFLSHSAVQKLFQHLMNENTEQTECVLYFSVIYSPSARNFPCFKGKSVFEGREGWRRGRGGNVIDGFGASQLGGKMLIQNNESIRWTLGRWFSGWHDFCTSIKT